MPRCKRYTGQHKRHRAKKNRSAEVCVSKFLVSVNMQLHITGFYKIFVRLFYLLCAGLIGRKRLRLRFFFVVYHFGVLLEAAAPAQLRVIGKVLDEKEFAANRLIKNFVRRPEVTAAQFGKRGIRGVINHLLIEPRGDFAGALA